MRIFLTGGTGFIGGRVAGLLRERGDEVRALARDPGRAESLAALGCEVHQGDLSDRAALAAAMAGCDAVIHAAAVYEVGIPKRERRPMYEANVLGTENVLGAALDAGLGRAVYVSTIAAYGNTHGKVVDETYVHPGRDYTSYYEETKVEAHRVAKRLIEEGLPCVIVQPGAVYGPGDHSAVAKQLSDFLAGRRLMGQPPNLRELINSADEVTFWGSHEKAMRELGYSPRTFEEGLRLTLADMGALAAGAKPG